MRPLLALTLLSAHVPSADPCNAANLAPPPVVRARYYSRGPVEIGVDDWNRINFWMADVANLRRSCRKKGHK